MICIELHNPPLLWGSALPFLQQTLQIRTICVLLAYQARSRIDKTNGKAYLFYILVQSFLRGLEKSRVFFIFPFGLFRLIVCAEMDLPFVDGFQPFSFEFGKALDPQFIHGITEIKHLVAFLARGVLVRRILNDLPGFPGSNTGPQFAPASFWRHTLSGWSARWDHAMFQTEAAEAASLCCRNRN